MYNFGPFLTYSSGHPGRVEATVSTSALSTEERNWQAMKDKK
jgi:hypothetical protein